MSRLATAFVLGYHGCDRATAENVLAVDGKHLKPSDRDYDWLGGGAYFWEADPRRALEWATERKGSRKFKAPYVVGAVIDLRNCLDLTVREDVEMLASYFEELKEAIRVFDLEMPKNEDLAGDPSGDKLLRRLDCFAINYMHRAIAAKAEEARANGETPDPEPFDTVRGMFQEGELAFEGSGIHRKTHTQIAVINPNCIKGYFRPRPYPVA